MIKPAEITLKRYESEEFRTNNDCIEITNKMEVYLGKIYRDGSFEAKEHMYTREEVRAIVNVAINFDMLFSNLNP